ncbi:MAG: methyltransferase domain-containing protein [Deltaproteobacteria bacterium]|nr:methyltransferase domain-containing protein [Deltaproteobacteria bacterium]TLN03139.1 MAG: methyltransferase [bacterium]
MRSEETLDELRKYGLKIFQPRHGYRFSLDPLLLCDFAGIRAGEKGIDLGAGCGIIPLVLARMAGGSSLVGVEGQAEMAELAGRNVALNGLSERIEIRHADILEIKKLFPPSSFDLVVANPPYRKRGSGRISPKPGRELARHESTATLPDFLAAAKNLVKLSGRICFIYHPSRLVEFLREAEGLKLSPVRLRLVHGNSTAEGRMFLVELVKGRKGDLAVLPPLFVYDDNGEYTRESKMIFGENTGTVLP